MYTLEKLLISISMELLQKMANVFDVAKYILSQKGAMSTWKLQKLCYYSQAWHYTWTEKPLFSNRIEAWANGPVVVDL